MLTKMLLRIRNERGNESYITGEWFTLLGFCTVGCSTAHEIIAHGDTTIGLESLDPVVPAPLRHARDEVFIYCGRSADDKDIIVSCRATRAEIMENGVVIANFLDDGSIDAPTEWETVTPYSCKLCDNTPVVDRVLSDDLAAFVEVSAAGEHVAG